MQRLHANAKLTPAARRLLIDRVRELGWRVAEAAEAGVARGVYGEEARQSRETPRRAHAADQKRYLRASPLGALDLTPLQRARVNAALADGSDPLRWLSPRQRAAARR